ncbi:MAG: hypothetical protein KME54_02830 [Tolypothrix brevis GSE-NOS-MK-07-07A]|nr:hypothetical protein [Tolypothrix brevis GSE-NOS-MK-07-07A]
MNQSNPDSKGAFFPKKSSYAIAGIFATAMWGMVGIFVRLLPDWSSFAILTGRFSIATVILLPIFLFSPSNRHYLNRSLCTLPISIDR